VLEERRVVSSLPNDESIIYWDLFFCQIWDVSSQCKGSGNVGLLVSAVYLSAWVFVGLPLVSLGTYRSKFLWV